MAKGRSRRSKSGQTLSRLHGAFKSWADISRQTGIHHSRLRAISRGTQAATRSEAQRIAHYSRAIQERPLTVREVARMTGGTVAQVRDRSKTWSIDAYQYRAGLLYGISNGSQVYVGYTVRNKKTGDTRVFFGDFDSLSQMTEAEFLNFYGLDPDEFEVTIFYG